MPKHPFRIGGNCKPALDLVSHGRRGPGRPERFTSEQVAQIARTVRRAPEVMVKVSGGGNSLGAVAAHFRYVTRKGTVELERDDGERVIGGGVARDLVDDWDLEIDLAMDEWDRMTGGRRASAAKLVHNIVLSMPVGTPPQKLLAASREFAREEFALQHRYAMVLHTDQDHPHVHLVVSAHKREGGRLNIRKADLRRWREQFARQLRAHGVEANATPAQVRGRLSDHKRDGAYWAAQRGVLRPEKAVSHRRKPGSASLGRITDTAERVRGDWLATVRTLQAQGQRELAWEVEQFRQGLRIPITRQEREAATARAHEDRRPRQLDFLR
ncbi:MAG TPA: relaxase/mobilization nuclease domain-containing protein [Steroidobacteraceae bacterium]|nr:relaxase/mobilization nuclease domain-containing protein [Steroidobacteraceae bacterium]